MIGPNSTIEEAQAWLRDQVKGEGAVCPCCKRWAKISKRKLNSAMMRQFLWLVGEYNRRPRWIHANDEGPKHVFKNFQLGTVAHWGLIEARPNDDPAKKTSGYWRPTDKGLEFAQARFRVPSHVYIYDKRALKFETGNMIDVFEALGRHFHYAELMNEVWI